MTRAMPWILASNTGYVADMLPPRRWGIKLSGGGHALEGGGHYARLADTEVQHELLLPLAHLR
jgi:hypothetical protein